MRYVLHMTDLRGWRDGAGDVAPDSLRTDGFVHASPDDATVLAVANSRFTHVPGQHVVLVVDTGRLEAEVRWEAASPSPPPGVAPDALFPHIYGPIPRVAVIGVRYLRRDPNGAFVRVERRGATAEALDMLPHPEGGWFRPTWRTGIEVWPEGYPGQRPTATGFHFLFCPREGARWHRTRSDTVWVFNRGGPLLLSLGGAGERPEEGDTALTLGPHIEAGHVLQALVPSGTWQAARPLTAEETLVSGFHSPGFDFADFETAEPD